MKISVDDQEILTLSKTQKQVLMNDINEEIFEDDIKRRIQYIVTHKYEQCFKRLKDEWEPKLSQIGVTMLPTNPDAFAELVFCQSNYKNRSHREKELKA